MIEQEIISGGSRQGRCGLAPALTSSWTWEDQQTLRSQGRARVLPHMYLHGSGAASALVNC